MNKESNAHEVLLKKYEALKTAHERLKVKDRYLSILNDFSTSLLYQNTVEEIVWDVAKNAVAKLGYLDCIIYLVDEAGTHLIQRAAHGPKNPIELDILNPIRIKIGEGIVGKVAKTGIAEIIYDTRENSRYIVDDEVRLSEISVPIVTDANKVIGVIDSEHSDIGFYTENDLEILKTIASITAAKLLQAFAQEKLKRSNEGLEQFAYIASHDLQEPLRMIASYSQLLERNYKKDLDQQGIDFLNYLREGAKRMNLLVSDLLIYSQIEMEEEQSSQIDLGEVMKEVLANLDAKIQETGAIINFEKTPKIRAHFSQMVQLFQNLISNAIKFQSAEIPRIEIKMKNDYRYYQFSVQDNGIGIEPIYFDKIFSIFKRLHSRKEYAGTGIGLAICKKIIENLGGRIWVESEVNNGTTFYFTIPK